MYKIMEYRLTKNQLLEILKMWSVFLRRKVHLIACGGTALTLLNIKASTKDVDFVVPDIKEYDYLIKTIKQLGYVQKTGSGWMRKEEPFIFDLNRGKRVHTTELLKSPLEEGGNIFFQEFSYIYLGILNDYDLISSKLVRGAGVDFEDCLALVKSRAAEIDINKLKTHYYELISYDISEDRVKAHWDTFERILKKENFYAG